MKIKKILQNFCKDTNLHGFNYTVQLSRHKAEKIFWSVSISTSFILTLILIIKFIIESQTNSVIIYTDQNVIKVQDINFPAISICPGLIYRIKSNITIDYDSIGWKLNLHGYDGIRNLTLDEQKLFQVANLVADTQFLSRNFPNFSISTDGFVEKMEEFQDVFGEPFYSKSLVPYHFVANWTNRYPVFLTRTLWKTGFCHTFNFPGSDKIFDMSV